MDVALSNLALVLGPAQAPQDSFGLPLAGKWPQTSASTERRGPNPSGSNSHTQGYEPHQGIWVHCADFNGRDAANVFLPVVIILFGPPMR